MSPAPKITKGPFILDGVVGHWRAICPGCGIETILDDDQYHGRISMLCECGYHETHDFSREVRE